MQLSWIFFFGLLNHAPSNAGRLACDSYKTVLHRRVHHISLFGILFVERGQDTSSFSNQLLQKTAELQALFDLRVSQNVDKKPLDVRENGQS